MRSVVTFLCSAVLGALLVACGSTTPPRAAAPEVDPRDPLSATMLMQQAQQHLVEGRVEEGIAKLEAARRIQPKNPTILNLLGVAELRRGNDPKALELFNHVLVEAPTYSDARNNRGLVYQKLGQSTLAEADFLSVLGDPTYANRAGVLYNLGTLYLAQQKLQAAEENLHRSTMLSGPVDAFLALGLVERQLGNVELADKNLAEASRRAPERADIALAYGEFLEEQGRQSEARELYRRLVSLSPSSPEAEKARQRLGR